MITLANNHVLDYGGEIDWKYFGKSQNIGIRTVGGRIR